MTEDFVPYKLAVKLKEKGFKEECLSYYTTEYTLYNNVITLTDDKYLCVSDIDYEEFLVSHNSIKYTNGNYVDAPTISQVLKWLREEKNIHIEIRLFTCGYGFDIYKIYPKERIVWSGTLEYETFEQAAIRGIEYTLYNLI